MRTTTNYALPYPESGDHTRTWEYWQGLADAVDAVLATGRFNKPYAFAAGIAAKMTGPLANALVVCDQVSTNKGPFTVNASGVTIPVKGVYAIRFQAMVASGSDQSLQLWIKTQAGTGLAYGARRVAGNANAVESAGRGVVQLNAGDVVQCYISYPGDVFPTDVPSGAPGTELTVTLLAPLP